MFSTTTTTKTTVVYDMALANHLGHALYHANMNPIHAGQYAEGTPEFRQSAFGAISIALEAVIGEAGLYIWNDCQEVPIGIYKNLYSDGVDYEFVAIERNTETGDWPDWY